MQVLLTIAFILGLTALFSYVNERFLHLQALSYRLKELMDTRESSQARFLVGELGRDDKERLYRLLGAYRGLSEAGVEYAGTADGIDCRPWRESRF